jgi:hypothetical protein
MILAVIRFISGSSDGMMAFLLLANGPVVLTLRVIAVAVVVATMWPQRLGKRRVIADLDHVNFPRKPADRQAVEIAVDLAVNFDARHAAFKPPALTGLFPFALEDIRRVRKRFPGF